MVGGHLYLMGTPQSRLFVVSMEGIIGHDIEIGTLGFTYFTRALQLL